MLGKRLRGVFASLLLLGAAEAARANAHTWDIHEVFSTFFSTLGVLPGCR